MRADPGMGKTRLVQELVAHALDQQLLINVTADKVIRLLPPLILKDEEAELLLEQLSALINVHTRHAVAEVA